MAGSFEGRDALAHVRDEGVGVGPAGGGGHDDCADRLAPVRIGNPHDRNLVHVGMG